MSAAAKELLAAINALPDADREEVVAELLTRHQAGVGDLPDAAFEELAEELFLTYDAAEADDATPAG